MRNQTSGLRYCEETTAARSDLLDESDEGFQLDLRRYHYTINNLPGEILDSIL